MAEITDELLHETLKQTKRRIRQPKDGMGGLKQAPVSIRGRLVFVNHDTSNICGILLRFDRIERRLDPRKITEPPQQPCDPNP